MISVFRLSASPPLLCLLLKLNHFGKNLSQAHILITHDLVTGCLKAECQPLAFNTILKHFFLKSELRKSIL